MIRTCVEEGRRKRPRWTDVLLLVLAATVLVVGPARAVEVDLELVLLVDVTRSVSGDEFSAMLDGYADSFVSEGMLDSIQSGQFGSIAASLVFYSGRNDQAVGVEWMMISDADSATRFAEAVRAASRESNRNNASIAGALEFATPFFGTETGGTDNGFESTTQSISIAGESIDQHSRPTQGSRETTVAAARDAALAAGVDIINALTIGEPGTIDSYFAQYVIGGEVGGVPAEVVSSEDFGGFVEVLEPTLEREIGQAVPEPRALVLLGLAVMVMVQRRSRRW